MKRNLIGILSLVVMSVMIGATANAQDAAKANVPFSFRVGSAQLPAGSYLIKRGNGPAALITVRNSEIPAAAMSLVQLEPAGNTHGKLLFHRVADQYFLEQVWTSDGAGMTIPTSKQERDAEKEMRMAKGKTNVSEEILIALN